MCLIAGIDGLKDTGAIFLASISPIIPLLGIKTIHFCADKRKLLPACNKIATSECTGGSLVKDPIILTFTQKRYRNIRFNTQHQNMQIP